MSNSIYYKGKKYGGGGGFTVNNAAVLTDGQAASYLSEQEIINVDVNNMNKVVYGAPKNKIIVQGNLCVPYDSTLWTKDDITAEIDLKKIKGAFHINSSTQEEDIGQHHLFTRMTFSYRSNTETYPYNREWLFSSYYTVDGGEIQKGDPYSASEGNKPNYKDDIPCYVGYILVYNSIETTVYPVAPYGYIKGALLKLAFNQSGTAINPSDYQSIIANIKGFNNIEVPFASQAELDYAVNVTQRADIAPSVTEGE